MNKSYLRPKTLTYFPRSCEMCQWAIRVLLKAHVTYYVLSLLQLQSSILLDLVQVSFAIEKVK
jgi:hypothetical protein